jgi:hypothetical protein
MTRFRPRPLLAATSVVLAAPLLAQTPAARPTASAATPAPAAQPSPTSPPPSREAIAEGKAAFAQVVASLGGREKIASIRDVRTRGRLTAQTPEGETTMEVQSSMIFPDYLLQEVDSPFGRVGMVVTPTGAFLAGPNGAQDLPPAAADELRKQMQRIPLNLARGTNLWVAAVGKETVGGVETTILDIRLGTTEVRWFVDRKSGRILRTSHTGTSPDGKAVRMVSDYHDYKIVEGVPVAHRLEITSNGERDQTLLVEEYRFNVGVDRKLFEKPPPAPSEPAHPAHAAPAAPTPRTTPGP